MCLWLEDAIKVRTCRFLKTQWCKEHGASKCIRASVKYVKLGDIAATCPWASKDKKWHSSGTALFCCLCVVLFIPAWHLVLLWPRPVRSGHFIQMMCWIPLLSTSLCTQPKVKLNWMVQHTWYVTHSFLIATNILFSNQHKFTRSLLSDLVYND